MHPYLAALIGGVVIGISATALLWLNGRVAGISGIAAGLMGPAGFREGSWRGAFLLGLVAGGLVLRAVAPDTLGPAVLTHPITVLGAGLLVGFGTQLGGGCTSGHGICGLSAASTRSLAAVMTFMGTGALAVFVVRHLLGGLR